MNIELDEVLVSAIKQETGLKTTKEVVDYSLAAMLRLAKQKQILGLFAMAKGKEKDWNLAQRRKARFA